MYGCVGRPIVCPPRYCVHDYCIPRYVPVIHPIVTVNRQNIVNVPQHYYEYSATDMVVDRGNQGAQGYGTYGGYNRLFF